MEECDMKPPGQMDAPVGNSGLGADDAAHWDGIVRRFRPALRGFFATRVRNPADIDDLVQEVFVQLLQRASGSPIEKVQQYLFQVAANVLCDQGRRRKVRQADLHESFDEDVHLLVSELSPERIAMGEEDIQRVAAALRELPALTRDVFFLRGIRNRKHDEVADMLGISRRSAHNHMDRALKHLAQALQGG